MYTSFQILVQVSSWSQLLKEMKLYRYNLLNLNFKETFEPFPIHSIQLIKY